MTLEEHFRRSGNWLFRWRSYLPLFFFGIVLIGLRGFHYPGGSHLLDEIWELICFLVGLEGLWIRMFTVGYAPRSTSGRNTSKQVAGVLNTTGMYSIVRHPHYLGNYFMWLGIALLPQRTWVVAVFTLAFWLYYERIIFAEETFLLEKFGEDFTAWARRTPAFFPSFRNWRPPEIPFSFRTVLKREYPALLALVVAVTIVELIGERLTSGRFQVAFFWEIILFATVLLCATLRWLKKKTTLLQVEGR